MRKEVKKTARKSRRNTKASTGARNKIQFSREERRNKIAETAYLLAEKGGFVEGKDMEYWLEAEKQIVKTYGE